MNKLRLVIGALLFSLMACGGSFEYEDWWMDSPDTADPSLSDPIYRISTHPDLTTADTKKPVIIAVHGYSASTFEWQEFRDFAEEDGRVLVSLVLLGGHGRNVDAFQASTWREWGAPIAAEYRALVEQGYTNISLAGSSTGGALVLEHASEGVFDAPIQPRRLFFIDAIVVPANKLLTMVGALGPILGNVPGDPTEEEKKHWYTNRPTETLDELFSLTKRLRSKLEDGITLPAGTRAKIYKTNRDESADPVSAQLMYQGLRHYDKSKVEVEVFDSNLHVFTRLALRDASTYGKEDRDRQQRVFREMIEAVLD